MSGKDVRETSRGSVLSGHGEGQKRAVSNTNQLPLALSLSIRISILKIRRYKFLVRFIFLFLWFKCLLLENQIPEDSESHLADSYDEMRSNGLLKKGESDVEKDISRPNILVRFNMLKPGRAI